jgi:hypothetical protein
MSPAPNRATAWPLAMGIAGILNQERDDRECDSNNKDRQRRVVRGRTWLAPDGAGPSGGSSTSYMPFMRLPAASTIQAMIATQNALGLITGIATKVASTASTARISEMTKITVVGALRFISAPPYLLTGEM